jgi:protein-S-isoprenylcysteine O-methyltransferase Ste14
MDRLYDADCHTRGYATVAGRHVGLAESDPVSRGLRIGSHHNGVRARAVPLRGPWAIRIAPAFLFTAKFAWVAFIPIDVFRLEILAPPSLAISVVGAVISVVGFFVILVTIYQNSFVTVVVIDQSERNQVLIETGLYSRIKHPMYTGMILWTAGLALWLESTSATIGVLALVPFFLARIHSEERFLRDTLKGYRTYADSVRHRLIPFVWQAT